ncbi:hypothetical protein TrLO_g12844 [Triparma laevis f. longispina]|uniref:EF-hand domain-containing protein n=1 Tax=Triparma laevis f. longispina TaxID=1714387 RepID=A0A9W7FR39_9STRA|nr:hypothetical protein TrLO_g12844 [Triparma laevis f. longispina]
MKLLAFSSLLLTPLASGQDTTCTATIETRTIDLMKSKEEWTMQGEMEKTLQIDRVDAVVFEIHSQVPYFFSASENSYGPQIHVDYCVDMEGNKVYPDWEHSDRKLMHKAHAKYGHVLKPMHQRPAAVARRVLSRHSSHATRRAQEGGMPSDFPSDFPLPSEDDLATCLDANPDCGHLITEDEVPDCDGYAELSSCVDCEGVVSDYLDFMTGCCADMTSDDMCGYFLGSDGCEGDCEDSYEGDGSSTTSPIDGEGTDIGDYSGDYDDYSGDYSGEGEDHGNHEDHNDEGGDDAPVCFLESGCPNPPEDGSVDCEWIRSTGTCIADAGITCDTDDQAIFDAWEGCLCNGECGFTAETVDAVIDPKEWKDPWLSSELWAGTSMTIPGYEKDAFGSFFRFDMNELQDSQWNKNPWDMFSPFTDMKYEWDETSSSCKPYVKFSQSSDEEFSELLEIDGVSAECAIRHGIAEKYEKEANKDDNDHNWYWLEDWDHQVNPLTMLLDARPTLRKASGAAPPTDFDGANSDITLKLKFPNGTEYSPKTKLTYKKYQQASSNAEARWQKVRNKGEKCTQVPFINKEDGSALYDGPFSSSPPNWSDWSNVARPTIVSPATCPRMVNGQATPRIEINSRKAAVSSIDDKKFINAKIVRKTSALDGKVDKAGYIEGLAQMSGCKLYVDGLFTADGEALCTNMNYGSQKEIPIKEPFCSYPDLTSMAADMTSTLNLMNGGLAPTDASLLLPFVGSDAWGSCSFLIDQALTFTDKEKTIKTMSCSAEWNSDEWNADPCCNWMLSETQCCAPREVSVMVPEASVDTERLAEYCASDVAQLTVAIYASKSFVETKKDSVDPTYGCVGDRTTELKKFEAIENAAKACADELYGEWDSSGKYKSTKVCENDNECASETCAAAASGETTRYCQTSMRGEHTAACLLKQFETIPKAKAILKDVTANGDMRAKAEKIGAGIATLAGREMCTGPNGWNYDPNWLSCKGGWNDETGQWEDAWNYETGMCDEYWCDDRDDCKDKCLNTNSVCNTDPWNSQMSSDSCVNGELDNKFCAMCWSGDQDCHEVSQAPKCFHEKRIWDQWHADYYGEWTQELCETLMGSDAVFKTEACEINDWNTMCMQSCEIPTAVEAADCINSGGICDTIGYTDKYGCFVDKPKNGDCWSDIDAVEVERSYCHGSDECNGFETEELCDGGDTNGDDCHGFDTWTEHRHFHEHWMEVTRHNWKPFCKYDDNFDSLEAANAGCPVGSTPQLSETKEQRCQHDQMCFSKDMVKSDCQDWSTMQTATSAHFSGDSWIHAWWDDDMDLCRISSDAMWGNLDGIATFATECAAFQVSSETWALKTARYFEEGRFHTEELCTAGVCDQDPGGWMGLTADECSTMESCSDWNCAGCERDWNNYNAHSAPDTICWAKAANQTHCEDKYSGTWTNTNNDDNDMYCLIEEHSSPDSCSHTYSECRKMEPEQCGGSDAGVFDNVVTKDVLFCKTTKWAECKNQEDCESKGFCQNEWGGNAIPDGFYNEETWTWEERSHICIAPEINLDSEGNEQDWFSCDAYGDWSSVEWSELGCVVKTVADESACTALTPVAGTWMATQLDESSCAEPKKCYNGQWFNRYNQEECTKCGNKFKPLLKWSGNNWMTGEMRSMYKWKDREFASANDWVTEIDRWMVSDLVNEVVNRLKEEVEGQFVKCMYGPLINSIEKIACVCGMNRDQCDQDAVIGAETSLIDTKAYMDAKATAGKQLGTKLEIDSKSVNNTAEIQVTSSLYVPAVRNGTGTTNAANADGTRRRRMRRLTDEDENSLNSAECMTVVVNDNNVLVGQLVGDCATLSIAEDGADAEFVEPAIFCINTNAQIERSELFPIIGVASKNGDKYKVADISVEESGSLFCFNTTTSITACPILYAADYADATEDLASGECGLISDIVQEIAMKQGCKMGDRKSCAWLEPGSLSHVAAIGTVLLVIIIVVSCFCSSCIGAWLHPKSRAVMKKHLNKAFFNEFDKDGDGMLDRQEIKAMLEKEFGEKFSKKQLDALFKQFDKDGNDQLDFEEYKVMMAHHKVHGHPPELQGDTDPSSTVGTGNKVHPS